MVPAGAVIAGIVAAIGYAIACRLWPYASCRRCNGGRKDSPSKRYWRLCKKCKGTGTRLRTGRRIWNWLAGTAHKAAG
jgi:DnaJ-class molecular chaperone